MLWFKKYLLPGFVFQSVLIGGGYGTGRELVEFFMVTGPVAGYFGMIVSSSIWAIVMIITYELARITRSYDYHSFLNQILGKGSVLYEVLLVLTAILVVSVMSSAAGELVYQSIGLPSLVGSILMMILVGVIVFYGTSLIEKVFSIWSVALYVVYFGLIVITWFTFDEVISSWLNSALGDSSWFLGGVKYAGYNIAILPALLYSVRYLESRNDSISAGLIGGMLGMVPALFVYTAMLSQYPEIVDEAIPANYLLGQLDIPIFGAVFQVILFGTFIETGIGYVHGFNERISSLYEKKGKQMPDYFRVLIAGAFLFVSVVIGNAIGLIDLIADGYGMITWGFIAVYVVPVLTIGLYKISQIKAS